jgi:cytochrome o ubiquinol oxidase subunit 2
MRKKYKIIIPVLLVAAVAVLTTWYLGRHSIPVLQPRGAVGQKERGLMIFALLLAVIVVVPTFALAIYIAIKYREENHTARTKYRPDFDRSRLFESIWWGIPIIIIGILCVVAWQSAHSLDPYKQLASSKKPLTVQVVALDWKWLFVYPEQHIASVNLAQIPVGTPVEFQVTSDTIMNSFWVPQLGGQIYAMPGMITQLHLVADKPGSYFGSPANIAGKGFSRMNFTVRAGSQADFDTWVKQAQQSDKTLNTVTYTQLAKPSDSVPVSYYAGVPDNFVNDLAMKYMMPASDEPTDTVKQTKIINTSEAAQ